MRQRKPQREDRLYDEDGLVIRENKEESKRERNDAKDFAKELLKLSTHLYDQLPIDLVLKNGLIEGKRLKDNAYRRHLSFLAKLLVNQNIEVITEQYNRINHPYRTDNAKINQTKKLYERVINNDNSVYADLLNIFENIDVQHLRQLSRNANKEVSQRDESNIEKIAQDIKPDNKPTKSEKQLYQYLFKLSLR